MSSADVLAAIASLRIRAMELGDPATPAALAMRNAYWVLDGTGSLAALCAALPRLVAQLDRRTMRRRLESCAIRGRCDWPDTVRARIASGNDAIVVSRFVERSYDVLENQLLRFVVARCLDAVDRLPAVIRDGHLQEARDGVVTLGPVRERVDALRGALHDRQLQARLSGVTLPPRLDARWTAAARATDVREYALVISAYDAWCSQVAKPSWDVATPGGVVLLPATLDGADPWLALAARRTARAVRVGGR